MPRRDTHLAVGAITGLLLTAVEETKLAELERREPRLGVVVLGGVVGAIGGLLPDRLEPATSPDHRGPFHGPTVAFLLWRLVDSLCKDQRPGEPMRTALRSLRGGWLSHVGMDLFTPAGLPLP
jgi:hypothetical protein